jgi:HEPN domain-containing protein
MKKTKEELVKQWLIKADRDLITAERELTFLNPITESVCFHSQQAVEKYLKAYLVHYGLPFTKTHEIGELITKFQELDPDIIALREEADGLTDYAVQVRYPDELYEPSIEEAREALQIAKKIKDLITPKLSLG